MFSPSLFRMVSYGIVWGYLVINHLTCTMSCPHFTTSISYTLLKYIGIRLYTEIINVKWQSKSDILILYLGVPLGSGIHRRYPQLSRMSLPAAHLFTKLLQVMS